MKFIHKKLVKVFEPMAFELLKASYECLSSEEKERFISLDNYINVVHLTLKKLKESENK